MREEMGEQENEVEEMNDKTNKTGDSKKRNDIHFIKMEIMEEN